MRNITFFLILLLTACEESQNVKLVKEFMESETIAGSDITELLDKNFSSISRNNGDTLTRPNFISSHMISSQFELHYDIISTSEPTDSTVEVTFLSWNKVSSLFGVDTVGYKDLYTIRNSRITQINEIGLPDYDYDKYDSIGGAKFIELLNWMEANYPEEYEQFSKSGEEAGRIFVRMAEQKYGR